MENLRHFDKAVLELGKKILAQFKEGEDRGILTSWMSHHIATLIDRAEREGNTPAAKEAWTECVETILKLWSHRNTLPNGCRPFERAERAIKTLSALAPEYPENFYFQRPFPRGEVSAQASIAGDAWLRFAEDFDRAARAFIRVCLTQSVAGSANELRDWVHVSQDLGEDPAADVELIRELIENANDEEVEEILSFKTVKDAEALESLNKLIVSLVEIRDAIALNADTTEKNLNLESQSAAASTNAQKQSD